MSPIAVVQQATFGSPSPLLLPERFANDIENSETFPSLSKTTSTQIPTRPSFITNKMSSNNSIPKQDYKESGRLLTRLPSVKNDRRHRAPSGHSTPDLSRSNSSTSTNTPILSPETGIESVLTSSGSEVSCFRLERKPSMESLASSEISSQYSGLSKEDQYLLHLKDVEGMTCWSDIAEKMCRKGFSVQQRGLRTRYCILKRDLDLNLQRSMANLSNLQSEVDELLSTSSCPVRRLASFRNKKEASKLRVYDEEDETVDPHVWAELAATFRASGLR